jgi:hypothetical protein
MTTVGLGEVHPFDDSAKVFTIFSSVFGVAAGPFTLGAVFEEQLEEFRIPPGSGDQLAEVELERGSTS